MIKEISLLHLLMDTLQIFKQELPLFSNSYSLTNTYDYKVYNEFADEWGWINWFFLPNQLK